MKSVFKFAVGKVVIPSELFGKENCEDIQVEGFELYLEGEFSPEDRTSMMSALKELPSIIPGLQSAIQEAMGTPLGKSPFED